MSQKTVLVQSWEVTNWQCCCYLSEGCGAWACAPSVVTRRAFSGHLVSWLVGGSCPCVCLVELEFLLQLQEDSGDSLPGGTEDFRRLVHRGLGHQQEAWRHEVRDPCLFPLP